MRLATYASLTLLFSIGPTSAGYGQDVSGPFGLRLGMSKAEVVKIAGPLKEQNAQGQYLTPKVPRPHPAFESYTLMISDTYGLCKIGAIGVDITMNAFGEQLKSKFNEIRTALQEKYGPGKTLDSLTPGSIWNEPQDWSMGLLKEERKLFTLWMPPTGAPGIGGILLSAAATRREIGYLVLSYESTDFDRCKADTEKAQKSVF